MSISQSYIHSYIYTYINHTYLDVVLSLYEEFCARSFHWSFQRRSHKRVLVRLHTYIHTYIHKETFIFMVPCIHTYIHTCMQIHLYSWWPAYIHTYIHALQDSFIFINLFLEEVQHEEVFRGGLHILILPFIKKILILRSHTYIHTYIYTYIHTKGIIKDLI